MASTVLRSVESSRSLRCSSRETPSWLVPSWRARLTWVSLPRLAKLAQGHLLGDQLRRPFLDLAPPRRVEPCDHVVHVHSHHGVAT